MELKQLTPDLSASGQIALSDLPAVKAAGFGGVIVARPDGEDAGQPDFATVRAAAERAGLQVRHVPVVPGQITPEDIDAFAAALAALPAPVLAWCRSGARVASLWSGVVAAERRRAAS